ncbi:sugar-binding transcriptional regulator [Ornithinibacillus halophilus]|uniref:Central glycolytic genes regulator n=1 Tax=Ornithinibacillus halophilus TaxID=930117 RepID=A0A1M5F3J7_9BACI|nr:sugar-binding domain-containing protein [Ornithinibacillus halophilus]SHF85642.1 central glycolytic genes regulator [Ornithinibacillus halophilus]
MRALIDLQKKLVPDLLQVMQKRYAILHSVKNLQPIGRRGLAENTKLTERFVRGEIDFLNEQGLIDITTKGMLITNEGILILEQLTQFMNEIMGLNVLEKQLRETLQIKDVIVVPGNSDEHDWVKQELGKACVAYLKRVVTDDSSIAVTGGTTMAAVASVMTPLERAANYLFVPARGGIGEKVENQANTIAAEMARKSNGEYRLLYVPDPISETSYQSIINEPSINEVLQLIKGASVVLHGIGDALTMASRRKTPESILTDLQKKKAVSEAFGYYFDQDGTVVHKVRTVGIQLEDLETIEYVITVAGGKSKGQAIASYFKQGKSDLLITDEAAAMEILRDYSL